MASEYISKIRNMKPLRCFCTRRIIFWFLIPFVSIIVMFRGSYNSTETVFAIGKILFAAPPAQASHEKMLYVTLRVRSGRVREYPSFDAEVAFGLEKGDTVPVIGTKEKWYHIRIEDGRTGWAHSSIFFKPDTQMPEKETGKGRAESLSSDRTEAVPYAKKIEKIRISKVSEEEEKAIFLLNRFYTPETFAIEGDSPRIVCDFFGAELGDQIKDRRTEADGKFIRSVRIGIHKEDNPKVRVVLDLVPQKDYDVEQMFLKEDLLYVLTFKAHKTPVDTETLDKKYGFED